MIQRHRCDNTSRNAKCRLHGHGPKKVDRRSITQTRLPLSLNPRMQSKRNYYKHQKNPARKSGALMIQTGCLGGEGEDSSYTENAN